MFAYFDSFDGESSPFAISFNYTSHASNSQNIYLKMPNTGVDIHGVFYKPYSFQVKTWYMLAFVNDGSAIHIYLDGALQGSPAMGIATYSTTNKMLSVNINNKGTDTINNGGTNANMVFGEIGVFNTTKSSAELLDYKASLAAKFGSPL